MIIFSVKMLTSHKFMRFLLPLFSRFNIHNKHWGVDTDNLMKQQMDASVIVLLVYFVMSV